MSDLAGYYDLLEQVNLGNDVAINSKAVAVSYRCSIFKKC